MRSCEWCDFQAGKQTSAGEREVQKALRRTLLKYHLHKDQDLFDRAYGYIRRHYLDFDSRLPASRRFR